MCTNPQQAWFSKDLNPSGKRPVVFKAGKALDPHDFMLLPCNDCMECRLRRSFEWSIRVMHELRYYDESKCYFLTLTYNNEHLPSDGSLVKKHLVDFHKRFSIRSKREGLDGFKYFACGEYGENFSRPHYHSIVYSAYIPDLVYYGRSKSGEKLYKSDFLSELWGFGFVVVGSVTQQSASYIARYVTKKVNGDMAESFYSGRIPEFPLRSRGLGYRFYHEFRNDMMFGGYLIVFNKGKPFKTTVPRAYMKLEEKHFPDNFKRLMDIRLSYIEDSVSARCNTDEGRIARNVILQNRMGRCYRPFESVPVSDSRSDFLSIYGDTYSVDRNIIISDDIIDLAVSDYRRSYSSDLSLHGRDLVVEHKSNADFQRILREIKSGLISPEVD